MSIRAATPVVTLLWLWAGGSVPPPPSGPSVLVEAHVRQAMAFEDYGPFLDSLAGAVGVPGLGFAVFNDGGVLYEHVGGVKNVATGDPVASETVFEAASISKTVFAYVVLSLVHEGVLDLDAPLGSLVEDVPEVAYDPRSAALTPRLLLTHQGGLPNWRTRMNFAARSYPDLFPGGDTLRFVSDPGAGYRYSGEGYVLLQRVVEARTGKDLNELAAERVFGPLGMTRSGFLLDGELRRDYAFGHNRAGAPDKWEFNLPLAASTLLTTPSDLALFGALLAGEIQADGPYASMARTEVAIGEKDGVEAGWGLGMGVVTADGRRYAYHTGNNVIFIADFVYGVEENLGYVLLTNSALGKEVADAVERRFFGRRIRPG